MYNYYRRGSIRTTGGKTLATAPINGRGKQFLAAYLNKRITLRQQRLGAIPEPPMSFDTLFTTLSHLPVAKIAEDVVESVLSNVVTMLSSATGSGKTLYVSSLLAEIYQIEDQGPVIVLVPRRFLAQNAAETICEIIGCEVGGLVGYAVGSQSGDRSFWNKKETKLLFATYGYAIASGLITTSKILVFDEVHETTMDLSIARALIYRRKQHGESIKVLEMSATFDPLRQAAYWYGIAQTKVFEIEGQTFPCEFRYHPAGNEDEEAICLIREGRNGILVFRPGVGEVQDTAGKIKTLIERENLPVDICQIYGDMDYQERSLAAAPPATGRAKILVGTNVMESGVNFPWVDAGVSCGTGKENSIRPLTGATYLELIDLPQWRIDQQEGRVKRFRPGVFVLCSHIARQERPIMTKPEIERLALTELVLHCANFGLRTDELTFDYPLNLGKVAEAEQKLQSLGLIDTDCQLTEAGSTTTDLPVGPETSAMLWHSIQVDCLPQMIALASVIEVGGLRKDYKFGHGLDPTSDLIDGLRALGKVMEAGSDKRAVMEFYNVSFKRYQAACEIGRVLQRKLNCEADFEIKDVIKKLRQCILAGSLDKLYLGTFSADRVVSLKNNFIGYNIGQGSCCTHVDNTWMVIGNLRTITPRDKFKAPFTIIESITVCSFEDLKAVAKVRPDILTEEPSAITVGLRLRPSAVYKLFGKYVIPNFSALENDDSEDPDEFESRYNLDYELSRLARRTRRW